MTRGQIINNLQTFLTLLITIGPTILLALGCTQDAATGALECSNALISPKALLYIVAAIGFIKVTVLPWLAPGGWVRNLFGDRAVVAPSTSPAATTGTVPPTAVR